MSPFKRYLLRTVFTDEVMQRVYLPALESEAQRRARETAETKAMVTGFVDRVMADPSPGAVSMMGAA